MSRRRMGRRRGVAPYVAGSLLVVGLLAGATPHAVSAPNASAINGHGVIGHAAFVAKNGDVYTVAVTGYGNTLGQRKIGPVTTAPTKHRLAIEGFVASNDGAYVAWLEQVVKRNGDPTAATPTLVLRGLRPSHRWTLKTDGFPIGFGGDDQLVVYNGHSSTVDVTPSPHLVKVPGGQFPTAVYPGGLVEVSRRSSPPGPKITEQVRLSTFAGQRTTVHSYVMTASDPRIPETAYVSPDGNQLLVERGDHTDFGGIGPSSLVDEFSLASPYPMTRLGHFGSAKAAWRVGAATFAWSDDEPWVVFERAVKSGGAQTAIAVYQHHMWRQIVPHGIAVAGNQAGYVIAQPGKYVFNADGLGFTRVPTGDALLLHDTVTKVLGIEASAVAWIKKPT